MCGSMADIQSAMAEIRRRKKKQERKIDKEETTGQKYTVNHKKRGNIFLTITLANLNGFL